MTTISANGWRALTQWTQASLSVRNTDMGSSSSPLGSNSVYYHEGEMPGYQSFVGYDPVNDVTLVIWTNLTLSLDGKPTANSLMLRMLDQIYTVSPLQ
jgi:D-alanyl-D-alanine carboxypeptidase